MIAKANLLTASVSVYGAAVGFVHVFLKEYEDAAENLADRLVPSSDCCCRFRGSHRMLPYVMQIDA